MKMLRLGETIKNMSLEIDDQEQRSRNAGLHGVNENDGDDTDKIAIDIINCE